MFFYISFQLVFCDFFIIENWVWSFVYFGGEMGKSGSGGVIKVYFIIVCDDVFLFFFEQENEYDKFI